MTLSAFLKTVIFLWSAAYITFSDDWKHDIAAMIFTWVFSLFMIVVEFFVFLLLSFHIYLIITGQSTYQIITNNKNQEIQKRLQAVRDEMNRKEI